MGIHALVNAPTALVQAPISPFPVTVALSALLWLAWPRIERRWPAWRPHPHPQETA